MTDRTNAMLVYGVPLVIVLMSAGVLFLLADRLCSSIGRSAAIADEMSKILLR